MINIPIDKESTKLIYTKYDKNKLIKKEINSVEEFLNDREESNVRWLDVVGLSDEKILQDICDKFFIHPLVVEDLLDMEQTPKVEDYEESLFIIAKNIILEDDLLQEEQIAFMLYKDKLLSFRFKDTGIFDGIKSRLRDGSTLRKNNPDDLLYALLDITVDKYFVVMEDLGDRLDDLQDETLENPDKELLEKVYLLKRDLISIRNILWPMRNTVSSLSKNEYEIINGNTIYYFRDIYDHIIQIIEINETYREIASSMLEIYLSSIGNKTNEVMKILTVFSSIFIPLTFIAGVYGMNFRYMPELYWKYSYPSFWIISIITTIYMLRFFKKKGWFE
ncbi:MAG: magnesium/cobalt transporter CorA [Tissierella sp.]|uniref:magnesium/cobalt transporter CorA n=1 Tax=Tissierella sp. TaxID=41274 RepID=UPI003F9809C3